MASSATAGIIFDIMKYSIHDGPGIRTAVFLKGCPLNCLWCHNPESQSPHPEIMLFPDRCIGCGECVKACPCGVLAGASGSVFRDRCTACGACARACHAGARRLAGRRVGAAEVVREINQDGVFYDESGGGVTFSGGEPLAQPAFLVGLLKACHARDIHTAIETCGLAPRDVLREALPYTRLWLFDLKVMDDGKHTFYTGMSNRDILGNLEYLASTPSDIIVRLPLIPGINDDEANIGDSGRFIAGLRAVREVHILPYHKAGIGKYERLGREYRLGGMEEPGEERVHTIAGWLEAYGLRVRIGG